MISPEVEIPGKADYNPVVLKIILTIRLFPTELQP